MDFSDEKAVWRHAREDQRAQFSMSLCQTDGHLHLLHRLAVQRVLDLGATNGERADVFADRVADVREDHAIGFQVPGSGRPNATHVDHQDLQQPKKSRIIT